MKRSASCFQLKTSERGTTTSEGGPVLASRPQFAAGFQQSQHLGGLAHAHIVGQAAAEAKAAEEIHPAQPFALVIAQLADEACGLRGGLHGPEPP